jgi:hypothetical protein
VTVRQFTKYEIQACVIDYEENGTEYIIPAPAQIAPSFWGLYGRTPDGLAEWIADYATEAQARAAMADQWGNL